MGRGHLARESSHDSIFIVLTVSTVVVAPAPCVTDTCPAALRGARGRTRQA